MSLLKSNQSLLSLMRCWPPPGSTCPGPACRARPPFKRPTSTPSIALSHPNASSPKHTHTLPLSNIITAFPACAQTYTQTYSTCTASVQKCTMPVLFHPGSARQPCLQARTATRVSKTCGWVEHRQNFM
eukprot:1144261-Pelagomonas_calceolata.AAC.2